MLTGLEHVHFRRGRRAILSDVTLALRRGERVAVRGPNGAGKTSLLRLLAGLERPDEGTVARAPGGAGYVPQAIAEHLFPWFSIWKNVAMPRLVARSEDAEARARALLSRLLPGVDPRRQAGQLSGGEQQIVSIARALAAPGELVLADEPFSALSSAVRGRVREIVREELAGRALVLVTHDRSDDEALCERIVLIEDGRIATGGTETA